MLALFFHFTWFRIKLVQINLEQTIDKEIIQFIVAEFHVVMRP